MSEESKPEEKEKITGEALQKILETQGKELEVRQQELEQQKIESEYHYDLSKKSIEAQERDRNESRSYLKSVQTRRYIFISVLALLTLFFLGFALLYGESELVMRIIEIAALIIAGGLGGYAIGYNRGRQSTESE